MEGPAGLPDFLTNSRHSRPVVVRQKKRKLGTSLISVMVAMRLSRSVRTRPESQTAPNPGSFHSVFFTGI